MKRLFFLLLLAALPAWATPVYVTQAGAGSANGTSLANAFSAADFNTAANWGGGGNDIDPGDVVYVKDTFTTRLTVQGSGTSTAIADRITITVAPGTTATLVGLNGGAFDYIAVIGINFVQTSTANSYAALALSSGSTGWLVYDCAFGPTYLSGISGTTTLAVVRRNTFTDISWIDLGNGGGSAPQDISLTGNSNLVEYNSTSGGLDRVRVFGTGCVVRNNYWGATDAYDYTNTTPQYPHHTDDFQSFNSANALIKFLYAGNYSTDSVGGADAHWMNIQDSAATGFEWYIFRFNLTVRMDGGAGDYQNIDRIYGYNNTFVAMNNGLPYINGLFAWDLAGGSSDISDWRNNTICYSPQARDANGFWLTGYRPTNFTSGVNHSYNTGAQGVLPTGASPANLAQSAPQFTDGDGTVGNDDYTLQSGSPLKATGSYITLANGAGTNSTTLIVDDAKRLFDGWSIADADYIKIGSGAYVQISSINYTTNTVTLSEARTWSDNDEVDVRGSEDVGALPYGSATAPAISSGSVTDAAGSATVVVADSFNVRFVELLVDGIPVATDYIASGNTYTLTWSGDGNPSHVFTAVAYAAWPSATPTVELQINVAQAATQNKTLRSPVSIGM